MSKLNIKSPIIWGPIVVLLLCISGYFIYDYVIEKTLGSKDEIPSGPAEVLDFYSLRMPKNSKVALFVPDIEIANQALSEENSKYLYDTTKGLRQKVINAIGFDVFNPESVKNVGIHSQSGFAAAELDGKTVIYFFIDDPLKIKNQLVPKIKEKVGGSEADAKSKGGEESGGVREVKEGETTMYLTDNNEVAWFVDGRLVTVVLNRSFMEKGVNETPKTVQTELSNLVKISKDPSLSLKMKEEGVPYERFKEYIGKELPISAYISGDQALDSQLSSLGMVARIMRGSLEVAREKLNFIGAGVTGKKSRIEALIYSDLKLEGDADIKALETSSDSVSMESYAQEDLMLALRLSVDPQKVWDFYLKHLDKESRAEFERRLTIANEKYDIDLKKQVVDALTGNASLLFYGIKGNPLGLMSGGSSQLSKGLSIALVADFKSQQAVEELVTYVQESSPAESSQGEEKALKTNELTSLNLRVLDIDGMSVKRIVGNTLPFNVYANEQTMLITSLGITPKEAVYLLTSDEKGKLLAQEGLELAHLFFEKKGRNGLYMNFNRFNQNLGPIVGMFGGGEIVTALSKLEEMSVTGQFEKQGVLLKIEVDSR